MLTSEMLRLYEDLWAGSEANDNSDLMAAYGTYVSDLLLIDSIEIFGPYCNQGIGGKIVLLIEAHNYCQVIALKPFDFKLSRIGSSDPVKSPNRSKRHMTSWNASVQVLREVRFRLTTREHMTYAQIKKPIQPARKQES
jgi:hypothetical protein